MIVQKDDHKYSVDIGRPSFFSDEDRNEYKKVFELIENSSVPIVVNGAYYGVRDMLNNGTSYGGGGFAFRFFFSSKEDRKEFARLMKEIKTDAPDWNFEIVDWRNVMFYQDLDKKIHLRFDEKYLPFAEQFAKDHLLIIGPMLSVVYAPDLTLTENKTVIPGLHLASGDFKKLQALKAYLSEQFLEFD